jgi:biopolymer transport protein ExbB/TolQ
MSIAFILRLSVGLAILYGAVIVVWYELIRSVVARRRGERGPTAKSHAVNREHAQQGDREPESAAHRAAAESEHERARGHYQLAREEARAERDSAIAAAKHAADEAVERIERRYREIDEAFIDEETERINELLRRSSGEQTP